MFMGISGKEQQIFAPVLAGFRAGQETLNLGVGGSNPSERAISVQNW
jgi:hypothetical protein